MNRSLVLFAIFFSLLLIVGVPYFLHERGFTPWMSYSEMDAYLKPLDQKDSSGRNFWDHRHWLNAVEGRWHSGQPEFRLRVGEPPKSGPYWWYWWFNQDQEGINKHIHEMSDSHFTLVYLNSFEWPDGTKRFSGVWHRSEPSKE